MCIKVVILSLFVCRYVYYFVRRGRATKRVERNSREEKVERKEGEQCLFVSQKATSGKMGLGVG